MLDQRSEKYHLSWYVLRCVHSSSISSFKSLSDHFTLTYWTTNDLWEYDDGITSTTSWIWAMTNPLSKVSWQIFFIWVSDGSSLKIPSTSRAWVLTHPIDGSSLQNPNSSSSSRCRARAEPGPSLRLYPLLSWVLSCHTTRYPHH